MAVLDIDGDGDWDVVNAEPRRKQPRGDDQQQRRHSVRAAFLESGVDGEYALNSGDMNDDGIADLVVGGQDDWEIIVLLGNGDGTFTRRRLPQDAGGAVWKLVARRRERRRQARRRRRKREQLERFDPPRQR